MTVELSMTVLSLDQKCCVLELLITRYACLDNTTCCSYYQYKAARLIIAERLAVEYVQELRCPCIPSYALIMMVAAMQSEA